MYFKLKARIHAFGDLDGDGDLDVLVGDELGRIHQFDNVAAGGVVAEFELAALSLADGRNRRGHRRGTIRHSTSSETWMAMATWI